MSDSEIKTAVRERYARAATAVTGGEAAADEAAGCCDGAGSDCNPITSSLYSSTEAAVLPDEAVLASLGCGNPTALAELSPGETVLDLGSGGGIDVLLSARRVGPDGTAYGLDMTDEMLELARSNQQKAGVQNAEFLKGEIEEIPLPDDSVDVIISNCVINLSADKAKVLGEAYRVLRPGGRFAVSDIVVRGKVPEPIRRSIELWVGCIAGALEESEYKRLLRDAGFAEVEVEPTRIYRAKDAGEFLEQVGLDPEVVGPVVDERFMAAFIRARKPAE